MKSFKYLFSLIGVIMSMNFEKIHAIEWREITGYSLTDNCRFSSRYDIKTYYNIGIEECQIRCRNTLECTHYFWIQQTMRSDIFQACYLQTNIVPKFIWDTMTTI